MLFTFFPNFNFKGSIVGLKSINGLKWQKIVCRTPYLSKHTSFDLGFCCTSLKWWHLQMFFSFFQIFGFWVVREGETGKKWPKIATKICLTLDLRNCTSCDYVFWYTCVKWWYIQQFFFIFFKILIFLVCQSSSINAKR